MNYKIYNQRIDEQMKTTEAKLLKIADRTSPEFYIALGKYEMVRIIDGWGGIDLIREEKRIGII